MWLACIDAQRLAPWRRTAAAQTLERTRPPAVAHAPQRRAFPCFRQDAGAGASRGGLAHRSMAGGLKRHLVFALRRRADPAGFAGLEVFNASSAGVASHRMARGRKRAN